MTPDEITALLLTNGFNAGWAVLGEVLTIWEHDADPPAPLTRPTEASNEASTTDADTGTSAE
jgi:hypothetical protein